MRRIPAFALLLTALLGVANKAAAGPLSAWYLTAGDQGQNWIIQGDLFARFDQNQFDNTDDRGEYAIAVGDTVRTLHNGNEHPGLGSEYTLAGVYTGVNYPTPDEITGLFDGTRDATHNYSVSNDSSIVYKFDLDWGNAEVLFISGSTNPLGITYDATGDGSLWVSDFTPFESIVRNYDMNGFELSSFDPGIGRITSLALDPADGTLWMGSQAIMGTFYQYSKEGTLLSTQTYSALANQNTLGGEFGDFTLTPVPEPASLALFCLGGLGITA